MKVRKKATLSPSPADFILIIILLALSLSGFLLMRHSVQRGSHYIIEKEGRCLYRLPIASDTTLTILGKTGELRIVVKNSKICVSETSCPLKICKKTGWIDTPGEMIICVPNRLIIRIEGEKGERVDAITE
jgi:hypothetical protein